jgi:hypothetical protein
MLGKPDGLTTRMMIVAQNSEHVAAGTRPYIVTTGRYEGQVTTMSTGDVLPFPSWATVFQDECVGGGFRLVAVTYPNRFEVGLIDPRLCPPVRSASYEEQQAARDAAWDERRRVIAHAEFCARAHRPTRPDIADAILAFGEAIEDEEHL